MKMLFTIFFRISVFLLFFCLQSVYTHGQKKPLDHSVYDEWQSTNGAQISNDGKWIVYEIQPQEGDGEIIIQSSMNNYKKQIPRGYNATITEDSRFVIFKINPHFKDTRNAKIKKKKTDELPKDSIAIIELGKDSIWKKADIKSYKTPEKGYGWVAYQLDKPKERLQSPIKKGLEKKVVDSLEKVIDSLKSIINPVHVSKIKTEELKDGNGYWLAEDSSTDSKNQADLVLRNLSDNSEKEFPRCKFYSFSKNGDKLLFQQAVEMKDSSLKTYILFYDLITKATDTLSRGGNDFTNFIISEDGSQVAYVAERDAKLKSLQKIYKLWHYKTGMDSARLLVDTSTINLIKGTAVSEFGKLAFSKSGKRLLFATAPIPAIKDTTLVEMDLAKLDIWNYKDDELQTVQLSRLKDDMQRNYLAVYDLEKNNMTQFGSPDLPTVYSTNEGDGEYFVAITDSGRRVARQWTGTTLKDVYVIDINGSKKLIKQNLSGFISPSYISPSGKFIMWYDSKGKNYYIYDGKTTRNITSKLPVPIYDEENDVPSDPAPYGIMGWEDGDKGLLIYDRYDIWRIDPAGKSLPKNITQTGRKNKITYRYIRTDKDEKFIDSRKENLLKVFNNANKKEGLTFLLNDQLTNQLPPSVFAIQPYSFGAIAKANNAPVFIYTKENYRNSPDLFVFHLKGDEQQLSHINEQQKEYNWGTAQLYQWTTFSGKSSTGILYKPENFDSLKRYPVIFYFYEKLSDGLYKYIAPAPTPSRLNISFFVSRGYLVFAPDIAYTIGHPAKSAYDYVVSAAKDLAKLSWVDAKNMGIQGQSWGGIQVAQLITMTDMFKAAWAGAPVANMTSAYGGIRWQGGVNRQFQYEKTQSRIGATLWQKPELYIENSPLFHLPKVTTPLVIMANDADGAVPWYQGIELYTAMRRLGKKVWMLNYNGEAHNIVQRRNRKDIQVREQQYFDWLLKGARPPKWITEGVPAIDKGRDWGLEIQ
ncbi:MAG: prolyl oligopeptidase family serine peptidase [Ginsengibacter sp.]